MFPFLIVSLQEIIIVTEQNPEDEGATVVDIENFGNKHRRSTNGN